MESSSRKKNGFIFIVVAIIAAIALFFIIRNKNSNNSINNNPSNATRLATSNNSENSNSNFENNVASNSDNDNSNNKLNEVNNRIENIISNPSNVSNDKEEELASFSTKLGSSSQNRLTNIRITCGKLNETIVENGETFSFCKRVGPATAQEGYKEATVFQDGKEIQALGGGNCQISSTLYNAVLSLSDLKVVERHPHGKKVSYVPEGKDAAVAYGSIDFRFTNNTGNSIKLYFSTDDKIVTAKIVKLY